MIYANISLTKRDIDKYYEICKMYHNDTNIKYTGNTIGNTNKFTIDKIVYFKSTDAKIIDVCCGDG